MQTSDESTTSSSSTATPQTQWAQALSEMKFGVTMTNLRTQYKEIPISMFKSFGGNKKPMRWPRVIRSAFAAMWRGGHSRVIIKAPRGGGKSMLLGALGFALWYLRDLEVVAMGGSLTQAKVVYGYFTEHCVMDASVTAHIDGGANGITMEKTSSVDGKKFACVPASQKQVRGKHPDVLISDETCETSDEMIDAAMPMVNDSQHPLIVMASTFHKIFGRFAETWDNAEERGYHRIQWDIFDVAAPFDPNIWKRPDLGRIDGIEKLQAFSLGRTGDPDGWITIEAIIQAWREKPTESWFEVEYLGTRPSSAGLVLKPEDVDRATFDDEKETRYNFVQGAAVVMGIDWGYSSMTSVIEVMAMQDGNVAVIENKNHHQVDLDDIVKEVVEAVKAHGIQFIYADTGSGNFANPKLRNALAKENIGCAVRDVNFATDKFGKASKEPGKPGTIGMLGNLIAYYEQHRIHVPRRYRDAYFQLKNYRYQEGSDKPVKENDHIPDALMCALKHWNLGVQLRTLHVQHDLTPPPDIESGSGIKRDPLISRTGGKKMITAGLNKRKF